MQTEQRLTLAGSKPDIVFIGFLEHPKNLDKFLEEHDFMRRYAIPAGKAGILSTIYSPDNRNNPQFAFSEIPLSGWEYVMSSTIFAEGILTISYPLPGEMKNKYDKLLYHLDRRFRITTH